MRCVMVGLVVCVLLPQPASATGLTPELPAKPAAEPQPSTFGRVGGEDIGSAAVIAGLPFSDAGSTCGYIDDYDEACPYPGSQAPDCVYSFAPSDDMCIDIDLCASLYDTKVFVYEDVYTPGSPYACNDDFNDCVNLYRSRLPLLEVLAGHVYYIVIDGYGSDCGDYVLEIQEVDCPVPCAVECPPDGIDEGEGCWMWCNPDTTNGGCNFYPYLFSELEPSSEPIVICADGGSSGWRDTDWYRLNLTSESTTITACVESEFPIVLGFVDMSPGCPSITEFYSYAIADPCVPVCLTETLPAGEWVVFAAANEFFTYPPCDDGEYVLTIEGYDTCVPARALSWSAVKGMYR